MNETIPPRQPGKKSPSNVVCAGIGVALFVLSIGLAFLIPPAALIGLFIAIVSLFVEGYRYIFLGYILPAGLILLFIIVSCATMHTPSGL